MTNDIQTLLSLYHESSPYYSIIQQIAQKFKAMENEYEKLILKVKETQKHQTSWHVLYNEVNLAINKRNELRRLYDHYDGKLERVLKTRTNKYEYDVEESKDEITYFERVKFILI